MTERRGEVFDLGYQHYTGPREGRMRARKTLWVNGIRTALGLGRGNSAKVLPALLFLSVMIPALVAVIVASAVGIGDDDILDHADYYQIVSVILVLFSAIIAPELLCADRRNGVINLYLVRPLTTNDYIGARWLAFFSVTLALVLFGQVVLLIGLTLAADAPLDYLKDNWLDVPRFLLAGVVVAAFVTTLPLAVSAFTTRRAYAAAFVIAVSILSIPIGEILSECEEHRGAVSIEAQRGPAGIGEQPGPITVIETCEPRTGSAGKWFALVTIPQVPMHVNDLIFDVDTEDRTNRVVWDLPDIVPVLWYLVFLGGPAFALWRRYRNLRI